MEMKELLGNCNCNDDYKKIRKKINEEQKKYKFLLYFLFLSPICAIFAFKL